MQNWLILVTMLLSASVANSTETLDVTVVDTEGGKAVILQSPSGQTMLIDGGYPTPEGRDTQRIVAAAKALKITQFDFVVVTHYDADHGGNIPNVHARIPGRLFIDHGEIMTSATERNRKHYYAYQAFVKDHLRQIVKPGDTIPMQGVKITVVTAGGNVITEPLAGAGQFNPICEDGDKPDYQDTYDNAGSIGLCFEFGRFRMLDLADLLSPQEHDLMCPINRIGQIDLLMVSHHGFKMSNTKQLVHAVHPKVAIMNNGPRKGGDPEAFDVIRSSPGLQDLWQMHYALRAGEKNSPENVIANIDPDCQAETLHISIQPDGIFTVTNMRNHFAKTYQP